MSADDRPTGGTGPERISDEELSQLGAYDPDAPDAADRLELVRFTLSLGAPLAEVVGTTDMGQLALNYVLRPRGRETVEEVAARCAVDLGETLRILATTGLPAEAGSELTPLEAGAVELLAATMPGFLGLPGTLEVARVAGSGMARLAEALVGVLRLRVELPQRDAGTGYAAIIKEYADIADAVLPSFMRMIEAILRQQMLGVAEGMWSTDDERSAVTLLRTVGFVDLVGYTATTQGLSVRELTDILLEFDRWTAEVVARGHGQVVKSIGDEVMFVAEHAADACRIALELIDGVPERLAPVRVGLATGAMVSVFGDLYGPDVNLASRLVGAAEPGTAVVDAATCAAVGAEADKGVDLTFEELAPLSLKGITGMTAGYRLHAAGS
jgi:adenylate cyclase